MPRKILSRDQIARLLAEARVILKKSLSYGAISGLLAGVALSYVSLNMHQTSALAGMAIGYLIMLVAFSMIFVAMKRQRDVEGGGVFRFGPALGLGIGISLVASLVYALCWDAALSLAHLHFGHAYAAGEIAKAKASGLNPAALAKVTAEWNAFAERYDHNILYRLPETIMEILPVGLLVSLVSALVLWKGWFRPVREASPEPTA